MAGSFFTRRFAYSGSSCTLEQPCSQWGEIISELKSLNPKIDVLICIGQNLKSSTWQKCPKINSCFDPSSMLSLQFLKHFDYIDDDNSSVIH